jgi:hypothetical protein
MPLLRRLLRRRSNRLRPSSLSRLSPLNLNLNLNLKLNLSLSQLQPQLSTISLSRL